MFVELSPTTAREIARLLRNEGVQAFTPQANLMMAKKLEDQAMALEPIFPKLDRIAEEWADHHTLDLSLHDGSSAQEAMAEIASRWEHVADPDNAFYQDRSFVESITNDLLRRLEEALR